jgi:hypothetical protein
MPIYFTPEGLVSTPEILRLTPDANLKIYRGGPALMVLPRHTIDMCFPELEGHRTGFLAYKLVEEGDLVLEAATTQDRLKSLQHSQYGLLSLHRTEEDAMTAFLSEADMTAMTILWTNSYQLIGRPIGGPKNGPIHYPCRCSSLEADQVTTKTPYLAIVAIPSLGWDSVRENKENVRLA